MKLDFRLEQEVCYSNPNLDQLINEFRFVSIVIALCNRYSTNQN